jgi:hypothetical protein
VVAQSTPSMEHFTTPSASDGKLFLATGNTVEAYSDATAVAPPPASGSPPPASGVLVRCTLRKSGASLVALKYVKRRHGKGRRLAYGTLALSARCTPGATARVSGTVAKSTRVHHRTVKKSTRLRAVRLTLRAGRAKTFRVRIPLPLVRALQHHASESARVSLAGSSAGGTGHSTLNLRRLRLAPRR